MYLQHPHISISSVLFDHWQSAQLPSSKLRKHWLMEVTECLWLLLVSIGCHGYSEVSQDLFQEWWEDEVGDRPADWCRICSYVDLQFGEDTDGLQSDAFHLPVNLHSNLHPWSWDPGSEWKSEIRAIKKSFLHWVSALRLSDRGGILESWRRLWVETMGLSI